MDHENDQHKPVRRISPIAIAAIIAVTVMFLGGLGLASFKAHQKRASFRREIYLGKSFERKGERKFDRIGMMRRGGRAISKHEYSGKISKIDGNNLTVSINNKDIGVIIGDNTEIYDNNGNIASKNDIKVDSTVTISGRPNSNGQINAKIITIK